MTPYVLVHGGAFIGACWESVLPLIRGRAIAPDLPGRGTRPADHAALTFTDCAAAIVAAMDEARFSQAHLVGHSLGGASILAVARAAPERVASLIFLAAPVPEDGATILSAVRPESRAFIQASLDAGEASLPTPRSASIRKARSLAVPEATRLFAEPVELAGISAVPAIHYIRLALDDALPTAYQDRSIAVLRRQRSVTIHEIDENHMIMLSAPAALARVLNAIGDG